MAKKRKVGRPREGRERLDVVLRVRVSKSELAGLKEQARAKGVTVGKLVRQRLFGRRRRSHSTSANKTDG
jgi:hypothetical protein